MPLTFRELAPGDRFRFIGDEPERRECTKINSVEYSYTLGGVLTFGRVGVGDNPVERLAPPRQPHEPAP